MIDRTQEPAHPMAIVIMDNRMARLVYDAAATSVSLVVKTGDAPRGDFDELKRVFIEMYNRLHAGMPEGRAAARVEMRFDLCRCDWVKPEYVVEWARLFREYSHVTDAVVERSTIVMSSAAMRAIVRTFMMVYSPRRPVDIVSP